MPSQHQYFGRGEPLTCFVSLARAKGRPRNRSHRAICSQPVGAARRAARNGMRCSIDTIGERQGPESGPGARMQSSQTLKRGQSSQCKKLSKPCRPGSAQRRRGTRGGGGGAHVAAPPRSAEASRRTRAKRCKWLGNRSAHECADFQEREVAHPLRTCGGRYCTCAPRACAGSGRTAVRECSQTQASGQMTRASPAYAWARGPNSLAQQLSHGTPHARARGHEDGRALDSTCRIKAIGSSASVGTKRLHCPTQRLLGR